MFATGLCMLLISFTVFAEVGKQNTTSLSGFVTIQIIFSIIQTILVTLAFWLI